MMSKNQVQNRIKQVYSGWSSGFHSDLPQAIAGAGAALGLLGAAFTKRRSAVAWAEKLRKGPWGVGSLSETHGGTGIAMAM